jgi:hypothetical protein
MPNDVSGAAPDGDGSGAGPTDEQHRWASEFCGIDTTAPQADSSEVATFDGRDRGSDGLVDTLSNVASSVADTVGDAVSRTVQAAGNAVIGAGQAVQNGAAVDAVGGAAPAPSSPGIDEGAEELAQSGFRKVVKAAPEVLEAAAPLLLGPLGVGLAVGAAVLLWSSDAGAAWDGQTNPETGKPYTSEEEWKAVRERRAKQQSGPDGDCNGRFQGVIDQLKLLEQLFEEATTDERRLWEKEQKGIPDDSGTTWSGHKKSYEGQRDELRRRIADWENNCKDMTLDENQKKELEMAKDYSQKDFPGKPEYAK